MVGKRIKQYRVSCVTSYKVLAALLIDLNRPLTRSSLLSVPRAEHIDLTISPSPHSTSVDARLEAYGHSGVLVTTSQPNPKLQQLLRLVRDHRQTKQRRRIHEQELAQQSDIVQQHLSS